MQTMIKILLALFAITAMCNAAIEMTITASPGVEIYISSEPPEPMNINFDFSEFEDIDELMQNFSGLNVTGNGTRMNISMNITMQKI